MYTKRYTDAVPDMLVIEMLHIIRLECQVYTKRYTDAIPDMLALLIIDMLHIIRLE